MKKRITIVGGGILGLTLAYELSKQDLSVTIIEKEADFGGLASGFKMGDQYLEKYYHHWFRGDLSVQKLIQELGLGDDLIWVESTSGIMSKGKLYDLSTGLDLLKLPLLGLRDRLRSALYSFYLQKTTNYHKFEQISAYEWCNTHFGKRVTRILWKPLLKGKFGKEYDTVSMGWLWARIHDRASSRALPWNNEKLGYLDGGFQKLVDRLIEKIQEQGVNLIANAQIMRYQKLAMEHQIEYQVGDSLQTDSADIVVSTLPGPIFTKIFSVSTDTINSINKVQYLGASCMILELQESLTPYYWLSVLEENLPFLAVIEHTNFIPKEKYNGNTIVYIANYLETDDALFTKNPEQLLEIYEPYLQKINPDFSLEWIKSTRFYKSAFAQHIVPVGYSVPRYETDIEGLYYLNFSQIYPHDRGTNYAIEQAQNMAQLLKNIA